VWTHGPVAKDFRDNQLFGERLTLQTKSADATVASAPFGDVLSEKWTARKFEFSGRGSSPKDEENRDEKETWGRADYLCAEAVGLPIGQELFYQAA
jgi:hypothetical protein